MPKKAPGVTVVKPPKAKLTPAQKAIRDEEYKKLERAFAGFWVRFGGDATLLTEQYPFRRWQFDFAILPLKIAIEIDGGTWTKGKSSHSWGPGIRRQTLKRNAAVLDGWRVLVFTSDMITNKEADEHITPLINLVKRELAENRRFIMKG